MAPIQIQDGSNLLFCLFAIWRAIMLAPPPSSDAFGSKRLQFNSKAHVKYRPIVCVLILSDDEKQFQTAIGICLLWIH